MRIGTWNEFDEQLKTVALIDLDVTEAGRVRDLATIEAEARFKSATATRVATRAVIVKELERFYRANRKQVEAGGKKSVELNFGRAGMRGTAAKLKLLRGVKWADVVARIKATVIQWEKYIQTKDSVKKDAVKRGLSLEELEVIGVTAKAGEEFFIETFPEKIERSLVQ